MNSQEKKLIVISIVTTIVVQKIIDGIKLFDFRFQGDLANNPQLNFWVSSIASTIVLLGIAYVTLRFILWLDTQLNPQKQPIWDKIENYDKTTVNATIPNLGMFIYSTFYCKLKKKEKKCKARDN